MKKWHSCQHNYLIHQYFNIFDPNLKIVLQYFVWWFSFDQHLLSWGLLQRILKWFNWHFILYLKQTRCLRCLAPKINPTYLFTLIRTQMAVINEPYRHNSRNITVVLLIKVHESIVHSHYYSVQKQQESLLIEKVRYKTLPV